MTQTAQMNPDELNALTHRIIACVYAGTLVNFGEARAKVKRFIKSASSASSAAKEKLPAIYEKH